VSRQTKEDLIQFFGINENKIEIIYQGCNEAFQNQQSIEQKQELKRKWDLPDQYILYVGTVEERKNLMSIVKALHLMDISVPLVVVGRHTGYAQLVKAYVEKNSMKQIHFLKEIPVTDLPGIYQMATVFIYPSLFEGFGIPILEALYSGVPVITSLGGCFREVGGESTIYIDPLNIEELGESVLKLLNNSALRESIKISGYQHAQKFSSEESVSQLMNLYNRMLND
jgi:glycosyltransferase involved in cell wall biosynthesis